MRKLLLAAVAALALGGTAHADILDYAAIYGGYTADPNLTIDGASFSMDHGYNVGAAFGWDVTSNFSFGVDLMYTNSDYKIFPGKLETFSVMGTAYYNFDIGSKWRPFVGAGIGGVQESVTALSGSDFVFGYQGVAGVSYPLAEKTAVVLAYKYQGASDGSINPFNNIWYQSHNISAGLIFNLQ